MATIISNGTGGGNWTTGSTWVGGVAPVAADNVEIDDNDTVTVDNNDTAIRCAQLKLHSGATLDINGGYFRMSGELRTEPVNVTSPALMKGRVVSGVGTFRPANIGTNYRGDWDFLGNSLTDPFIIDCQDRGSNNLTFLSYGHANSYGDNPAQFRYVKVDGGDSATPTGDVRWYVPGTYNDASNEAVVKDNIVTGFADSATFLQTYSVGVVYEGWYFYGSYYGMYSTNQVATYLNCVFGEDENGVADANTRGSYLNGGDVHYIGCHFETAADEPYKAMSSAYRAFIIGTRDDPDVWRMLNSIGNIEWLAAAAYTGSDHGLRMTKTLSNSSYRAKLLTAIEGKGGESFVPKVRWRLESGYDGHPGEICLTLDPGNTYGMEQTILIDMTTEGSWQQAVFTGATLPGTDRVLVPMVVRFDAPASGNDRYFDIGEVIVGSDTCILPCPKSESPTFLLPASAHGGGGGDVIDIRGSRLNRGLN